MTLGKGSRLWDYSGSRGIFKFQKGKGADEEEKIFSGNNAE